MSKPTHDPAAPRAAQPSPRRPRRLIGLDLSPDAAYVVVAKRRGRRVVVEKALALQPAPDCAADEDAFAAWLRRGLDDAGVAPGPCALALPRRSAVVKPLQLPPGREADRRRMAEFQAEKVLPFPLASARMDFAPAAGDGPCLLAAARAEDVDRWTRVAERAGMPVDSIKVNPLPYARAAAAQARLDGPALVAFLGETEAEIAVVADGAVSHDRGVALGPGRAADRKTWRAKLWREVRRTLMAFGEQGESPTALLLCGQGPLLAEEAAALGFEMNLDVRLFAAGEGEPWLRETSRDAAADLPAASGATRAAAAAAEALLEPADALDLARSRFQTAAAAEHRRRARVRVLAAATAAAALGLPWAALAYRRGRLAELGAQAETLRPKAEQLADMERNLRFFASWRERRPNWLEVLRALSRPDVMPYGLYVTSMTLKETPDRKTGAPRFELRLSGRAKDAKLVDDVLIPKMRALRMFGDVKLENVGPPSGDKGRAFKLTARIVSFETGEAGRRQSRAGGSP